MASSKGTHHWLTSYYQFNNELGESQLFCCTWMFFTPLISKIKVPLLLTLVFLARTKSGECPGNLQCISEQICPQSKELLEIIDEASKAGDYGELGKYYTMLGDLPECGNSRVCCQQQQQNCGKRLVPDSLHIAGGSNVTIIDWPWMVRIEKPKAHHKCCHLRIA